MFGFDLIDAGRLYTRYFHNQEITQSGLAQLIAPESAALGRVLDRLAISGWAKWHPHPGDRRARSLAITEEARALLPVMSGVVGESQRDALHGFSIEERQILMSALERVLANWRRCAADTVI
jgi:MarR family transcriptional regulator, transcriptional regulator for hemolysin